MSERNVLRLLFIALLGASVVVGAALWTLGHQDEQRVPAHGVRTWTTAPDSTPTTAGTPFVPVTALPPRPAVDLPSLVASSAVKAAPKVTRRASRKPTTKPTAVYYANCDAVRDAGAAPIRRGDPGWRAKFDRDGDGTGCDT